MGTLRARAQIYTKRISVLYLLKCHKMLNGRKQKKKKVDSYKVKQQIGIRWAVPSKKVSSIMRKMHRFRFLPHMNKVLSWHLLSTDSFYSVQ